MANKYKLSFIIVSYNTSEITQKCVQTINKFIPNQEIIVVDNGSQDDTVKQLKKIDNVKIVENGANFGFSKANNIGLKIATSNNIIFLNSDIELIDNSLIKMLEYFKKHPETGIIGPQFLNPDLSIQDSVFPEQNIHNAFKEFWQRIPHQYSKYTPTSSDPQKVWAISGGFILTKKDYFESIGAWNEKYFFYFEDMDLCRKINKNGGHVVYFPECKVIHRHGASGKSIASADNQWKRLIPGSKKYHGIFTHYAINFVIWSSQKRDKLLNLLGH